MARVSGLEEVKSARRRLHWRLMSGVAIAVPMMLANAYAQESVDIDTEITVPLFTSTANNGAAANININDGGAITLDSGTALTIDSDNSVFHNGSITIDSSDDSIGILVDPDITAELNIAGAIVLDRTEDQAEQATNGEVPDYADNRAGVRISEGGTFTGDLIQQKTSDIIVYGDESFGIDVAGAVDGNIELDGTVSVQGLNSFGVRIGDVLSGDFLLGPNARVAGQGVDFTGIGIEGDIGGVFNIQGSVVVTAYSTATPEDGDDEDDNTDNEIAAQVAMQARAAVAINADVAGGFVVEGATDGRYQTEDYEAPVAFGSVAVSGSANAILIQGENGAPITLGAFETPETTEDYGTWGFVNRGEIETDGFFQGASAETVRIENAIIENGIRNDGIISSAAIAANATTFVIGSGADVPMLVNEGSISTTLSRNNLPDATGELDAIALLIEQGGNLPEVVSFGIVSSSVVSDEADAIAVQDLSGSLTSFVNQGLVIARVSDYNDGDDDTEGDAGEPTGNAIAFDFSNNTAGVTIKNTIPDFFEEGNARANFGRVIGDVLLGSGDDTYRHDAGSTVGNIDLGAGNDTIAMFANTTILGDIDYGDGDDALNLTNSSIFGAMEFGDGADVLNMTNNAQYQGAISDADGMLSINISDNSALNLIETDALNITDFFIDGTSVIGLGLQGGTAPQLMASGNVTLEDGARILPIFESIFTDSISQEIFIGSAINVDPTQIIIGDEDGNTPFIFDFDLSFLDDSVDAPGNQALVLDINRKTAEEIGLDTAFAEAYEPLIAQLTSDEEVGLFILNAGNEAEFMDAFTQMLAGPIDAPVTYARAQNNAITSIITQRLDMARNSGEFGRTFWLQEENYFVNRDDDETSNGFDGGGWMIAAGVDFQLQDVVDAFGASLSVASARYDEKNGEDFPFDRLAYSADLYGAFSVGGAKLDLRGSYGITDSESERRIVLGTERRIATAQWDGSQIAGSARLSYDADVSGFTLTPFAAVDYIHVEEDPYEETGGGDGVNLAASAREATSLRTSVGARVGKVYELRPSAYDTGIPGTLHPQLTLAWSQELETDPYEAEFRYVTGTDSFNVYSEPEDGAAILGADIAYENEYAKVHVGASGTFGDKTESAMLRVGVGLKW